MNAKFGLGTFSINDEKFVGVVVDEKVVSIKVLASGKTVDVPVYSSVLAMLEQWDTNLAKLEALLRTEDIGEENWIPLQALKVHPPVDLPRQVFCTGANYRQHVIDLTLDMGVGPEGLKGEELRRWAENMMDERAATGEPYVFTKPVSTIAGAYDPIVVPNTTAKLDWELELAVVIGKAGYQISKSEAMDHVAGYAIVNDITARDLIARTDYKMIGTDWLRAKGQPGFLPFGPYLVPAKFIGNPMDLTIKLAVSGQVMQNEKVSDMLFGIDRQIEYISRYARLLPGDIICTGSPAGNGTHYQRYLQAGDLMEGSIDGLGQQRATLV